MGGVGAVVVEEDVGPCCNQREDCEECKKQGGAPCGGGTKAWIEGEDEAEGDEEEGEVVEGED